MPSQDVGEVLATLDSDIANSIRRLVGFYHMQAVRALVEHSDPDSAAKALQARARLRRWTSEMPWSVDLPDVSDSWVREELNALVDRFEKQATLYSELAKRALGGAAFGKFRKPDDRDIDKIDDSNAAGADRALEHLNAREIVTARANEIRRLLESKE
jgi:hypothetical protein